MYEVNELPSKTLDIAHCILTRPLKVGTLLTKATHTIMMTDTTSDMIARIKNAQGSKLTQARVIYSKLNTNIAKALLQANFIQGYSIEENGAKKTLIIDLRYIPTGIGTAVSMIGNIKRISKPGRRRYYEVKDYKYLNPRDTHILSTSKGVISAKHAAELGIGGEALCFVN